MLESFVGFKVVRRRLYDDQGVIQGVIQTLVLRVEPMSNVPRRIRLSELSCVSSRHHHYKERRIDSRIDQVKAQVSR
jgi:hypothetical protein